jgi:meiotically up-regulated gene 157 (Mug157) protein
MRASRADTGFMHEAFYQDDPQRCTRRWHAWTNPLFGELILRVLAERPAWPGQPP